MPKYEIAYYLGAHEQWEYVHFKELAQEERRAELREKDLREAPNGVYYLGIRNHPHTPHFFQKRAIRTNIEQGCSESERHENQKNMIYNFLNKYPKHAFGNYEKPWDKENKGYKSFIKIKDYTWCKEVSFGLVYGKYIRFDILGRHKSKLSLTDKYPYIAIEIFDTSFHSQNAFIALLELTKNIPIIILYMFVEITPRLNSVVKPQRINSFTNNRIMFYLSDGSFWIDDERIEDTLEGVTPDTPKIYYNLIEKRLYDEGCLRK